MISDGTKLIEDAKKNYLRKSGQILTNPETYSYWSLINSVLNKAKLPIMSPLVENGLLITDVPEKAQFLIIILYFNVQLSKMVIRFQKMPL